MKNSLSSVLANGRNLQNGGLIGRVKQASASLGIYRFDKSLRLIFFNRTLWLRIMYFQQTKGRYDTNNDCSQSQLT